MTTNTYAGMSAADARKAARFEAQAAERRAINEQLERDREAARRRSGLPRMCYLPGCHASVTPLGSPFCEPSHRAVWEGLPEFAQSARGLSLLAYRDDLELTLALAARDQATIAEFNAAYADLYGDPIERLAKTAREQGPLAGRDA